MERIGVRELRQNASVYLRRVAAGESIAITDRGIVVGVINPPQEHLTLRDRLIANGELLRTDQPRSVLLEPGVRSCLDVSAELQSQREDRL